MHIHIIVWAVEEVIYSYRYNSNAILFSFYRAENDLEVSTVKFNATFYANSLLRIVIELIYHACSMYYY